MPGGVIAASRAAAPPVICSVGWPEGRLTTPRSEKNTPRAEAGTERLRGRFLGREALGIGCRLDPLGTARALARSTGGEHASRNRSPWRAIAARSGGCRRCRSRGRGSSRRSTPARPDCPPAPRSAAMTVRQMRRSRTSTSSSASMNSGWRLTIFRLAIAPSCCATALVSAASAEAGWRDHAEPPRVMRDLPLLGRRPARRSPSRCR